MIVRRHARHRCLGELHDRQLEDHRPLGERRFHLFGEGAIGVDLPGDGGHLLFRRRPRRLVPHDHHTGRDRGCTHHAESGAVQDAPPHKPALESAPPPHRPQKRDRHDHDAVAAAAAEERESGRPKDRIEPAGREHQHDPKHLPRLHRHVSLPAIEHRPHRLEREPEETGQTDDALIGSTLVEERRHRAVAAGKPGQQLRAMAQRRDKEILDLEAVEFEPLVFPDQSAAVGTMGQFVGPGVEIHEDERGGGGGDDGQRRQERRERAVAAELDEGAEERQLAENVGVVDMVQASDESDRDRPPPPPRPGLDPRLRGDPAPHEQEQRDRPGVGHLHVVRTMLECVRGKPEGEGRDETQAHGPRRPACDTEKHRGREEVTEEHAEIEASEEAESFRQERVDEERDFIERREVVPVGLVRRTEVRDRLPEKRREMPLARGLQIAEHPQDVALLEILVPRHRVARGERPGGRIPRAVGRTPDQRHRHQEHGQSDQIGTGGESMRGLGSVIDRLAGTVLDAAGRDRRAGRFDIPIPATSLRCEGHEPSGDKRSKVGMSAVYSKPTASARHLLAFPRAGDRPIGGGRAE